MREKRKQSTGRKKAIPKRIAKSDPKKLAAAIAGTELGKTFEVSGVLPGDVFQYGAVAATVALVSGRRVIKIMARLPQGTTISKRALRAIYNEWCGMPNAPLSQERALVLAFATELTE